MRLETEIKLTWIGGDDTVLVKILYKNLKFIHVKQFDLMEIYSSYLLDLKDVMVISEVLKTESSIEEFIFQKDVLESL